MEQLDNDNLLAGLDDPILITGAAGFIGSRVVQSLLERGFRKLICFVRPSSRMTRLEALASRSDVGGKLRVLKGNLLSWEDCVTATREAVVTFHLAAGGSDKSFPDAFMNSVVTTRNLLEASLRHQVLKRFVNVSSFAVYSNTRKRRWRMLDESSPVEARPELRGDAYCYAKVKQDEIVAEYGKEFGIPYVIVRPGYVYGPDKPTIPSRIGIDTFGIFLHMGGSNRIPLTYVDNCAEAIVLAGLRPGIEGDIFNVVDDDLPSSREFLQQYHQNVRPFRSISVPHVVSFALSWMWERYSNWSQGQLPPVFNRRRWHAYWKKTRYSNKKLKTKVGWTPKISMADGLRLYFEGCRNGQRHA
jgi:2-alkyl-3-oxoalkanoate reductase